MNIIMHYPKTSKKQTEIMKMVAKVHAQHVEYYVNNLECSTEQKVKLIEAIAQSIHERSCNKTN